MAAKPTKATLIAVSKDFNKVLKLKPPIEVGAKATVAGLTKDVTEVIAEVVQAGDKFSAATNKTLAAMGLELPGATPEEETNPADPKPADPKPAASPFKKRSFTRVSCVADVLKKATKPMSRADLAEKSNAAYEEKGGADNLKESKWATKISIDVLVANGFAEIDDDKAVSLV